MNNSMLTISGRDTLRHLGIYFRPFANSECATNTISGAEPSFIYIYIYISIYLSLIFWWSSRVGCFATILSTIGKFSVHAWNWCGGSNKEKFNVCYIEDEYVLV